MRVILPLLLLGMILDCPAQARDRMGSERTGVAIDVACGLLVAARSEFNMNRSEVSHYDCSGSKT